jgi:hypothetical protein
MRDMRDSFFSGLEEVDERGDVIEASLAWPFTPTALWLCAKPVPVPGADLDDVRDDRCCCCAACRDQ